MRLISKKGMNVYGITLEIGRYTKSENVMYGGGPCKQHHFANIKLHFSKWTFVHLFSLWGVNAEDNRKSEAQSD